MRDKPQSIIPHVWLILGLIAPSVLAEEATAQMRWKNGDVLPGTLLESTANQIRWSSPQFLDDLLIGTDSLDAIIFRKQTLPTTGTFRITTTAGDLFTADLIDSDNVSFVFTNNHFGQFRVNRETIYSLNRIDSTNLVFDGARLDDWNVSSAGPIDDLKYKVFKFDINDEDVLGKNVLLTRETPVREGRLTGGVIDLSVAGIQGAFAMRFEGQIDSPRRGDYEFDLWTEDQARLFIDGELVVDFLKDRRNPEKPAIGIINLREGNHAIRVDYLEPGGPSRLAIGITDPDGRHRSLIGRNRDNAIWASGPGGLPRTNRKQAGIFRRFELPNQVEINLDFAAEGGPRFVMALGRDALQDESGNSLRLETWDNELVIVQEKLFEPILILGEDQHEVRLRLVVNDDTKQLSVFDDDGQLLVSMNDIEPSTGDSGIYIRNRGEDLTVRRLSVYRQGDETQREPVDGSKARVHLISGEVAYGRLFVQEGAAYVVDQENRRQDIDLSMIDRIARPDVALSAATSAVELSYSDGAIVRGQIESATADQIHLRTVFSESLITCALAGASSLQFGPPISEYGPPRSDSDQFISAAGRLRGRISFDLPGAPLSWQPDGTANPLRLSNRSGARIELGGENVDHKLTFDDRVFPSAIYLNNGELIPCRINSYDETTIGFESPFTGRCEIASRHVKAVEFEFTRYSNPQDKKPDWLDELLGLAPKDTTMDRVKLERALTIPRSNRQNPPTHILVANNGDMKRGKLLGIDGRSLQFESKMRQLTIPIDRLTKVVRISSPDENGDPSSAANAGWHGAIRTLLSDGSVFLFQVENSKDGSLTGRSEIYGDISIPVRIIQELNIGGFEPENFEHRFKRWVVKPAKEPDFGIPSLPKDPDPKPKLTPGQNFSESKKRTTVENQSEVVNRRDLAGNVLPDEAHDIDRLSTNSNLPDLGKVIIDPGDRSLRFPIRVNQRGGLVEYALVTDDGKTHESVFRTDAEPTHIHLGLLLLGGKPVYAKQLPSDPSHKLPGDTVQIDIAWKENGVGRTRRLGAFIVTINNAQNLPPSPWVYNGSVMTGSGIEAQRDGSIVSLRLDPSSLLNNPRPGRMNDELHHANTAALPADNVSLEMVMRLAGEQHPSANTRTSASRLSPDSVKESK